MVASNGARGVDSAVRWLMAIGLFVVSVLTPAAAWAYWGAAANGTATATVTTLPAPVVTATVATWATRAELAWTTPAVPPGMVIQGYYVQRLSAGGPSPACGTGPSSLLAPTVLACSDTGLADGDYTFGVTAVVGSWTTTGASLEPVVVAADHAAPSVTLTGFDANDSMLALRAGGYRLFYRSTAPAGGAIRISALVSDAETGPASATFPAIAASGWAHAAETVTVGTGASPDLTYASSPLAFTVGASVPSPMTVSSSDSVGNTTSTPVTFVSDTTAPVGGVLAVNGTSASAAGTSSTNATGSYSVTAFTPFSESPTAAASGMVTSSLVRETAPLVDSACGTFDPASATDVPTSLPVVESGLPPGCYRYTATAVDAVGNQASIATTVRSDSTPPLGGGLTVNGVSGASAGVVSGSTASPWLVTREALGDPESDPTSNTLTRSVGTLSAGSCSAYGAATPVGAAFTAGTVSSSESAGLATGCYKYTLTGANGVGATSSLTTTVELDTSPPSGGALTVNAVAASSVGTTSTNTTGTFTVSVLTAMADTNSGMIGTLLTRTYAASSGGVCQAFDGLTTVGVTGTLPIAQAGLVPGCYRYVLTGTNGSGGTTTLTTTVRTDSTGPAGGALSVNGVDGTAAGTNSFDSASPWSVVRSAMSDPESDPTTMTLTRAVGTLSANACTAFGAAATVGTTFTSGTVTSSESAGLTTACYRYVLTGRNGLNVAASLTTTVKLDTTAPTGGALTVNGVAASAAGTVSTRNTTLVTPFTVSVLTNLADAQSGMLSNTLVRTWAPIVGGVCQAYDSSTSTTISGTLPISQPVVDTGCYRYVLTGTNNAGLTLGLTTTVLVDLSPPVGGALTVNGTDADVTATTSLARATGWSIARTAWTDADSAATTTTLTRSPASYTAGSCGTFSATLTTIPVATTTEGTLAIGCYRYVLTGTNSSTQASAVSAIVRLDNTPPTGGGLTVNAVAASALGSTSTNTTGTFTVSVLSSMADANSGMVSSVVTRTFAPVAGSTCGTFDAATTETVSGTLPIAQAGLAPGCYKYVLTGTNGVGGTTTLTTTVRTDSTAPTAAVLTINGVDAGTAQTSSSATGAGPTTVPISIARTDFTDPETTMTSSILTRTTATLTNGVCGTTFGTATVVAVGTTSQDLTVGCWKYTLVGTNALNLVTTIGTVVAVDPTLPSGGAFTVNAVPATAGGSSSLSPAGSFSVSVLTHYTDAQSGLASSTLVRTQSTVTGGICDAFAPGSATTVSGTAPIPQTGVGSGCYRYVLTGVNGFGGTSSLTTTVRFGP